MSIKKYHSVTTSDPRGDQVSVMRGRGGAGWEADPALSAGGSDASGAPAADRAGIGRVAESLELFATIWAVRYDSGDAEHRSATGQLRRQLRAFVPCRVRFHADHSGIHRGWVRARLAGRDAAALPVARDGGRVRGGALLPLQGFKAGGGRLNTHSRLALRGAAFAIALAAPVVATVWYWLERAHAFSFLYVVGVGVVGFASIALTVTLLTVRPSGVRILLGVASYGARIALVVAAVGVAVYADAWPVLPMLCGLAGVYVVENLLLLKMAPTSVRAGSGARTVGGGVERRTGV